MINNDVLRSVRFMLNVGDDELVGIVELGGLQVPLDAMVDFLKKDHESGYRECPDDVMAHFLDGLIIHLRGREEGVAAKPVETAITNNTVLKKLRVAFELQENDILAIMEAAELRVSRHELRALFRNPGHANFRACGDQFLRKFLRHLTRRVRVKGGDALRPTSRS